MRWWRTLVVAVLSSCAAPTRDASVLQGRPACAGDVCAPGVDELRSGEVLFEQVSHDAAILRTHLLDVSDRSTLFGPDIRRFQRMLEGFDRVKGEGLERLGRHDRRGAWARLNALILTLPVMTLQLEYLILASRAEDAGVVSTQWLAMLDGMRVRTEPILDAMVGFDLQRMEAAAAAHRRDLAELQEALPRLQQAMVKGVIWTETAVFWANTVMATATALEMADAFQGGAPGSGGTIRFPALAGAGSAGGVVVVSAEALEALRELIRIGAVSPVVVSTVAAMAGPPELPSGAPGGPRLGRTHPSRPPDPKAKPRGEPEKPEPRDSEDKKRAIKRQNESAATLARAGFDVEQLPIAKEGVSPDFRIEGRVFDGYAPTSDNARNIWSHISTQKVNRAGGSQTSRIVLNLADSSVDLAELQAQFHQHPMLNLEEVIAIKNGELFRIWP